MIYMRVHTDPVCALFLQKILTLPDLHKETFPLIICNKKNLWRDILVMWFT